MAALELFHRIFTHAPDVFETTGWRHQSVERDAKIVLSAAALEALDDLLAKLCPVAERAWAIRRFATGNESFGCVVVSYHGFADAGGRVGLLNHARIVRLAPENSWFNPVPLIEDALAFPIREVLAELASERAQKYVDALAGDGTIVVPEMQASLIEDLDRKVVADVLVAAIRSFQNRPATKYITPSIDISQLALAWASLPAGLQQWSSFAEQAKDGVPVDAIWSDAGTKPSAVGTKSAVDCVTKYLNLLLDSSYDHNQIVRDMNVRTTLEFQQMIDRATIETGVSVAAPATQGGQTDAPQRGEESDGDPELEEVDRNYQAMYRSLRDYVDKRLAAYEAARPATSLSAPPASPPAPAPSPPPGPNPVPGGMDRRAIAARYDWRVIATTAVISVVLYAVGQRASQWITKLKPASTTTTMTSTTGATATGTTATIGTTGTTRTTGTTGTATTSSAADAKVLDYKPVQDVVATCRNWDVCLKNVSEQNPDLFAVIVDRAIGDTVNVPRSIRTKLEPYSDKLKDRRSKVSRNDRMVLRPLLFEYVVKQKAADKRIDGNLNDVTTELLQTLHLTTSLNNINEPDLHSEAILRWIADQGGAV